MTIAEAAIIPLVDAYLCGCCNCIGNDSRRCPACASESLLSLARVLNRKPKEGNDEAPPR